MLAQKPTDAYSPFIYNSALYGKSWLDPSPNDTNDIFRNMIDSVLSGGFNPKDAISDSSDKLDLLLNKYR